MKELKYGKCAQVLAQQDCILILTHRNPDGDTVGSAAALCSALRRAGKKAFLYPNPQITGHLRAYAEEFIARNGEEEYCDFCVAVDVAEEHLFAKGFEGKVDLCIDHHEANSHYAVRELVKADCAACGELILKVIKAMGSTPTAQEATLLYMAIATDTGCFQYSNTDAMSFAAASELAGLGADLGRVSGDFFRKVSMARLKLEGEIYSSLSFHRDGKITVATVTQEMLERTGASEDDCGDLAGLAGRVEGSLVSVTIRERPEGGCRVSVRSAPGISSCDICAVFGGGGHTLAAGCTISASPEKTKEMLLAVIDEIWNERDPSDR